jgi:hydroxymethylbilane synthase
MSRALAGSCTVPLGAYAVCEADHIRITGFVASVDGKQMLVETASGDRDHAETLGKALANQLLAKGADKILALLDHV